MSHSDDAVAVCAGGFSLLITVVPALIVVFVFIWRTAMYLPFVPRKFSLFWKYLCEKEQLEKQNASSVELAKIKEEYEAKRDALDDKATKFRALVTGICMLAIIIFAAYDEYYL